MIQVNLLPDVKLEYLKAQRNKNLVLGLATIVTAALLAVTILLALHVYVNQAIHTAGLQADIDSLSKEYTEITGLDEILTIDGQLRALPGLHEGKPAVSRLPELLVIVVPKDIELAEIVANFDENILRIDGQGKSTKTVNTFADILKNTFYATADSEIPLNAFSGVTFDIGIKGDEGVTFEAEMSFDPEIFNEIHNVDFTIPSTVSTQSKIRTDSSTLFDTPTVEE